jgi:predicted permease
LISTASAIALIAPVLFGAIAGALRLFREPERAIDALNLYALNIAFPALVCGGLASAELALPSAPGFWVLVPIAFAIAVLGARLAARAVSPTIALTIAFGNVAYLGLPVVEQALGASSVPAAALAVAIHVLVSMTAGLFLFLRWSGDAGGGRAALRRVLKQPLLWAPLAGLALRLLPSDARPLLDALLTPIGRSAAPVALFLLGLYLHVHRDEVRRIDLGDAWHLLFKLVVLPAITFALAYALRSHALLGSAEARVLFVLSAMPAAITTFSMARDAGHGVERVSRTIVLTTLASALTIPIALWLASRL